MNKIQFAYSAYWRTWSRVLIVGDTRSNHEWVELNITHVNGDWGRVVDETIRVHRTAKAQGDLIQDHLPLAVTEALTAVLGEAKVKRLMTFDYLANISLANYSMLNASGGGVPYNKLLENSNVKSA